MSRLSVRADVGIGALAVSPAGRDVVLAGSSGLYIVDLADPFALPRCLPLRNAWEVSTVVWSPDPSEAHCVVSASNQKALVWDLRLPSDQAVAHVLQGHRRAITDIRFGKHDANELVTASIDTSVALWDLRASQAPTIQFVDFSAGALQAAPSPTNPHRIASAHDNRVVLWDRRWANRPVLTWETHIGECNGLEFLANGKMLTCSSNREIRVWNVSEAEAAAASAARAQHRTNRTSVTVQPAAPTFNPLNEPGLSPEENLPPGIEIELTVVADFPVWRALPTPYELGALVVPLRGGDNAARVVNLAGQTGDVKLADVELARFEHATTVTSAAFLRTPVSRAQYDVVTWSRDAQLRQWRGDPLLALPHASSAAGCKDDAAPLPVQADTFSGDAWDATAGQRVQNRRRGAFDVPVFNTRRAALPGLSHVDWIAGVRIEHEAAPIEPAGGAGGHAGRRRSQAASEELSQEIVAVSARLPRVAFDDIDIWAGACEASLMGPWGRGGDVVHLRASVRVPPGYPYEAMRCWVVDAAADPASAAAGTPDGASSADGANGSALDPGVDFADVNRRLAAACVELSRHGARALEFCVRLLVGDPVSLEDALSSVLDFDVDFGLSELPDFHPPLAAGGSSGSGAAETTPLDAADAPEAAGEFEPAEIVAPADEFIDSTPLPKNCGAVWSNTGQLVCFFNTRAVVKERGPLPLDKIFADDAASSGDEPFLSDSDDFDAGDAWAAQFAPAPNAGPVYPAVPSSAHATGPHLGSHLGPHLGPTYASESTMFHPGLMPARSSLARSGTATSGASERLFRAPPDDGGGQRVLLKSFLWLWPCRPDLAADYRMDLNLEPLATSEWNAGVARRYRLWEDERIWRLLANYIKAEEREYGDPLASLVAEQPKFDWARPDWGFQGLLSRLADGLERRGNIQLLVAISTVLSALRARRDELTRDAARARPPGPVVFLEPGSETLFRLRADGTVSFVARRANDLTSVSSGSGSASAGAGTQLTAPAFPFVTPLSPFSSTDSLGRRASASKERRQSSISPQSSGTAGTQGFALAPSASHGSRLSVASSTSGCRRAATNGNGTGTTGNSTSPVGPAPPPLAHLTAQHPALYIATEIFDDSTFEHLTPSPSAVYPRGKSRADEGYLSWMTRLVAHREYYAALLHVWGLDIQRAEVLKLNLSDPLVARHAPLVREKVSVKSQSASVDMRYTQCVLCDNPIVKTFEFCAACSHALHSTCARSWWAEESECPTGCGCPCKERA